MNIKLLIVFILLSIFPLEGSATFRDWTQFQSNYSGIKQFQVHSIFSRQQGQQTVFVRLFQARGQLVEPRNIKTQSGWVHIEPLDVQTSAYFYFSQMSEAEMNQFLKEMPKIPLPSSPSVMNRLNLIPSAEAQMWVAPQLAGLYYSGFFDVAASCVMGVGSGAYASTVGLAVDLVSGAYELINDPISVAIKLERTWTEMKTFFSSFQKNMDALIDGVASLPPEAKADMLCGMVGSIGADVLIAYLTVGGGSPKLALTIQTYLSKIKVLESTLRIFTRFGATLRRVFTADFYHRLSLGKIPRVRLNTIEIFGKVDQVDLAVEAAACVL